MKKNWLKNKLAGLALAFSSVEKSLLSQNGEQSKSITSHTRRSTEGQLMDALLNGIVTQEVKDLRWRMYKSMQESEKYITKIIRDKNGKPKVDSNGLVITETRLKNLANALSEIITEPSDNYPIELVIDNSEIAMSVLDALTAFNDVGIDEDVSPLELAAGLKTERPIIIQRESRPKFDIETYTTKLHIRAISDTEKLLEFYVSKYPDEFNRTSRLFIGEVKKGMTNPELCNMLQIQEVGFITYNAIGADNHCQYHYEITGFDKIVEFKGDYVIKFKAKVLTNGENILAKYMESGLEDKYKNKVKRKVK